MPARPGAARARRMATQRADSDRPSRPRAASSGGWQGGDRPQRSRPAGQLSGRRRSHSAGERPRAAGRAVTARQLAGRRPAAAQHTPGRATGRNAVTDRDQRGTWHGGDRPQRRGDRDQRGGWQGGDRPQRSGDRANARGGWQGRERPGRGQRQIAGAANGRSAPATGTSGGWRAGPSPAPTCHQRSSWQGGDRLAALAATANRQRADVRAGTGRSAMDGRAVTGRDRDDRTGPARTSYDRPFAVGQRPWSAGQRCDRTEPSDGYRGAPRADAHATGDEYDPPGPARQHHRRSAGSRGAGRAAGRCRAILPA